MHDLLLQENNLEKINALIIKWEKIPFVVGMAIAVPLFINKPNFLFNVFYCTIGVAILIGGIEASMMVGTRYTTKHINGVKNELTTAYQLKEELEQKLSNIKDKSKDSITSNIVKLQNNDLKTDDIIILEEITPFCEEAAKKLEDAYKVGYKQKGKKLVLKK